MSPYRITINNQDILNLSDNECCPISDTDLFQDLKKKRKTKEIQKSKFYLPNYDADLIQNCLYVGDSYFEQNVLSYTDNYIGEEPKIIDIGANIGNHTLYWANEKNAAKIYAFEPIEYTFNILKKNIEINSLEDRVSVFNVGMADKECLGEIKTFCPQNLGGTRLKILQSDTKFTIPLKTLDSYKIKEDKIDLIKIDVEGMDFQVLEGAQQTIKKYKPAILIESFPDAFEKSNGFLEKLGYMQEKYFGSFEYLYIFKDNKKEH